MDAPQSICLLREIQQLDKFLLDGNFRRCVSGEAVDVLSEKLKGYSQQITDFRKCLTQKITDNP